MNTERGIMQKLVDLMIKNSTVGVNEEGFILKSGKKSYWYVNCRNLSKSLQALSATATLVVEYLQNHNLLEDIDYVLGVPEGGTLLGHETSKILIKQGLIKDQIYSLRAKAKTHGDPANKYWSNGNIPKKLILLEDVTSTGGSVIELAKMLRDDMGVEVVLILSLVDRLQLDPANGKTVRENMQKQGLEFKSILTAKDFLATIIDTFEVEKQKIVKTKINQEYFEDFGENSPIKL